MQSHRYKTILLFGAPGSGKGTQGKILGSIPGFVHVACGDIFRDLRVGSPLGQIFLEYSSKGQLVPDEFTVRLWREYIMGMVSTHRFDAAGDILVLDGIPRNIQQARFLEEYVDVRKLYYLDCVDKAKIIARLQRRAIRENRLDDANEEVIRSRMVTYEMDTSPVLNFYPPEKVCRIDTGGSPIEVVTDILCDIRTLGMLEEHDPTSIRPGSI